MNRVGTDGTGKHYNGHSGVYDPRGNTLAFSENEEVLQITLSHEDLDNYRAKFPAYLDSND